MRVITCTKWKTASDVKRILEGNGTTEDEGELSWALGLMPLLWGMGPRMLDTNQVGPTLSQV